MKKKIFMVLVVLFLLSGISYSEDMSMRCGCKFETCANELGVGKLSDPYIFVIDTSTDSDVATKYTKEGRAVEVLMVSNSQGGISFLEVTKSGGIITTTIDLHGTAVYSRNVVLQGKLLPTQCYGQCICKELK